MKLDAFMKLSNLDEAAMAAKIGDCSEGAVRKWRYGERMPRRKQLERITQATDGAVTANDFYAAAPPTSAVEAVL